MSAQIEPPIFTHFSSDGCELPSEYYMAIGQAFYRWSQLEATVCSITTSLFDKPWLDAVDQLRGKTGFKVKNNFDKLKADVRKRGGNEAAASAIDKAEHLYSIRKEYFHSTWGIVSGGHDTSVGINEWNNEDYAKFRAITLLEILQFAIDCREVAAELYKSALPVFHGSRALAIDDGDGMARRVRTDE